MPWRLIFQNVLKFQYPFWFTPFQFTLFWFKRRRAAGRWPSRRAPSPPSINSGPTQGNFYVCHSLLLPLPTGRRSSGKCFWVLRHFLVIFKTFSAIFKTPLNVPTYSTQTVTQIFRMMLRVFALACLVFTAANAGGSYAVSLFKQNLFFIL